MCRRTGALDTGPDHPREAVLRKLRTTVDWTSNIEWLSDCARGTDSQQALFTRQRLQTLSDEAVEVNETGAVDTSAR